MQAVIEAPYYEDEFICPWQVPEFKPFERVYLHGKMTDTEIGLVFATIAEYNNIKLVNNKQIISEQILEAQMLIAPGGIEVSQGKNTISPSCCCGLESWREWTDFLTTGNSPWLGHDPSPWLEIHNDLVYIWSDGGLDPVNNAFHIDVSISDFQTALAIVEQDLQDFLLRLKSWLQTIGFTQSDKLCQKMDECFSLTLKY